MTENSTLFIIQILWCIICAFVILLVVPISIYYSIQIWKLRHESFFGRRQPVLTQVINAALIWLYLIYSIVNIPYLFELKYPKHLFLYGMQSPFTFFLLKGWYLYYDYHRQLQLLSLEWKSKLNNEESINHNHYHWTLNKKYHWLSDQSNALYYICIVWIISCDIIVYSSFAFNENKIYGSLVSLFILCIYVTLTIPLVIKIRKCRDELFIRSELKKTLLLGPTFLIGYIAVLFLFKYLPLQILIWQLFCATAVTVQLYITTKWILQKYYRRQETINNYNKRDRKISFKDALKNEHIFDIFAETLVKEFAIENLLFLYEVMSFKNQCVENKLIEDKDIGNVLEFGKETDEIKFMVNDMNSFYINFKYLFDRYIDDGGCYCINISSATRNKIKTVNIAYNNGDKTDAVTKTSIILSEHINDNQKIVNENEDNINKEIILEIIQLMDDAMSETIQLLTTDSFTRFVTSQQFKQLYMK